METNMEQQPERNAPWKKDKGPSLATKVREVSAANPAMTADEIAKMIGTKKSYVHTVWYMDRKKSKGGKRVFARKVGRPPKAKTIDSADLIERANKTLNDVRVTHLQSQIADLKVVIRYLEGKLYGAPV